ncbi:hypothetical protein GAYE_SCF34G5009 [Galdieria yellowstonensis]|uniref:Uncharacterized protein n=1 Tax=Galdieria yellowstonensis TaxID=3028027 RepID=A0AAV9IIA8_9RHOD|nr:hypothetical protein GAYE_SCF34G5009 [Galdieria yellowstonensis]
MSDLSESVLVETRYSSWKNGGKQNVFTERGSENKVEKSNKVDRTTPQKVTSSTSSGIRRTNSCPLFLLLRQDALEGKKVRLGKGALEYLRHRQERSLSRSLSQSDLATIEEVEEELNDNAATDAGRQVLTDIQKNSWYPQKAEYNIPKGPGSVQVTEESRKQLVEKATKVNSSGSSRVSRRTLEKLAEDYSKRKIGDNYAKLPPLPRSRNLTAHESSRSILEQSRNRAYELSSRSSVSSVEKTRENSSSSSLEPDYYSMYHGVFVEPNNASDSCQGGTSALSEKEVGNSSQGDNSLLLNQNGIDGAVTEEPKNLDPQMEFYSGRTLWEPPSVWKIPEYHQWTGHDMRTNEHGGWWTERWGCSLDKTFRFGDKYGVDNDGAAWAEWWLERDLDIQEGGATMFVKKGKRWGYNQKHESWMESWYMTANGTYYTEFQMIPPSQFSEL